MARKTTVDPPFRNLNAYVIRGVEVGVGAGIEVEAEVEVCGECLIDQFPHPRLESLPKLGMNFHTRTLSPCFISDELFIQVTLHS